MKKIIIFFLTFSVCMRDNYVIFNPHTLHTFQSRARVCERGLCGGESRSSRDIPADNGKTEGVTGP